MLLLIGLLAAPSFAVEWRAPAGRELAPVPAPRTPLMPAMAIPELTLPGLTIPQLPVPPELAAQAAPEGLSPAPGAPGASAGTERPSMEKEVLGGRERFDGAGAFGPVFEPGWSQGGFESAAGGEVAFKRRAGGPGAPRVYSGGLALNESFDPLFAAKRTPARSEYFLWTRGHPPTAWSPVKSPLDADARDLARLIVLAGKESPNGKVELALHSFGTLVFQRLVQLRAEPEAREALRLLSGSRVVMLHATTHYEGSERQAGPEFERMGMGARMFIDWLDAADAVARQWEPAAKYNPLAALWLAQWRAQREQALAMAAKGAVDMQRADLKEPWDPSYDQIRRSMLAAFERDARDPGWQEALLRRSSGMFRLDFTKKDAAAIRRLGIKLELVHAAGDKLLNWASAKILFERLGIDAPEQAPAAGTELKDRTGRFRARIVDGDHYFPLKKRDELARILDR